ncbi:MAG: glycosyltransferase [Flavobacteriales bacterium]
MGKRIEIVINYDYNEDWIGGTYYIQNLIHALNSVEEDEKKPILLIKSKNRKDTENLRRITGYPYMEIFYPYKNLNKLQRGINKLSRKILNKNLISIYVKPKLTFPAPFSNKSDWEKMIYWIPDFQEKKLPHFFSEEELSERHNAYTTIQKKTNYLVFSSKDAQNDFNTYYPNAKPKQFVLNFAVTHDKNLPHQNDILKKFNIEQEFYLCSNQFWIHKNHIVILNTVATLKKKGIELLIVFTGKENDYRNPDYFLDLMKKVKELAIENNVKFLGFIDRKDQLVLMQTCKAVVQPSLFEGWSTVIEDAKAQSTYVLAANLQVNTEQLQDYPNYTLFDPYCEESLSEAILKTNFETKKYNYHPNIIKFGNAFLSITEIMTGKQ